LDEGHEAAAHPCPFLYACLVSKPSPVSNPLPLYA
jgi:hypothetical protein